MNKTNKYPDDVYHGSRNESGVLQSVCAVASSLSKGFLRMFIES
jgi:hypothetical protein